MKWTVLETEEMFRCRPFTVHRRRCHSATLDRTDDFFVLEARDWANVVPLTPAGEIVCVRQFRHGTGDFSLEVPAGLIDASDADPAAAAVRELREETGYRCTAIEPVGVLEPNPALFTNRCHVFLATGVEFEGAPQWDANEEMTVERVPAADLGRLVRAGHFRNALTVAALHLASLAPAFAAGKGTGTFAATGGP